MSAEIERDGNVQGRWPEARSALARAIEAAQAERVFFQAGREAFWKGMNEGACPHPSSSGNAKLWLMGFTDARDSRQRRPSFLWDQR